MAAIKARQDLLKTFSVDYDSAQDNMRYIGKFTIKKLAIRDIAALGVRKAQLNGGMYYNEATPGRGVDEQTDDFNNMIAHLELSVKESPEWWNLDSVTDVNLLGLVFKEVIEFEQTFLGRTAARALARLNGEGSGTGAVSPTNNAGSASQVVGAEVQAALEP